MKFIEYLFLFWSLLCANVLWSKRFNFEYDELIPGTYTQNGSTVTMKISGVEDLTVGTISGNTLFTEGGYFGGMTMIKTDNLIM